jgi:hypothetical protein
MFSIPLFVENRGLIASETALNELLLGFEESTVMIRHSVTVTTLSIGKSQTVNVFSTATESTTVQAINEKMEAVNATVAISLIWPFIGAPVAPVIPPQSLSLWESQCLLPLLPLLAHISTGNTERRRN